MTNTLSKYASVGATNASDTWNRRIALRKVAPQLCNLMLASTIQQLHQASPWW
jgi:hypothetical protein